MFIDQGKNKEQEVIGQKIPDRATGLLDNKMAYLIAFISILAIAGVFFMVYFKNKPSNSANQSEKNLPVATSTVKQGKLPSEFDDGNGDDNLFGTSTGDLKAEDIFFGLFYKKIEDDFKPNFKAYDLPVNIKVDAVNYYDISRKIDFDKYIPDLDKYGYKIFENNISPQSRDFFSLYRFLLAKQIPIIITEDFIIYYYQNTFKKVYKEIEKNVFYENVWDINNKLFTIALTRYKKKLAETGAINDPVLEAERLELAYFATALKILSPDAGQISAINNLNDAGKFNQQEAEKYDFAVPDFLKDDVEKEAQLIRAAKGRVKSPVFLYDQDYENYAVPVNYKNNAKLNNFYLALKWYNSVFPVNYKSNDCANCLLDYNDWVINMAAANFIAKDLADNQDLKNRWAIIYKFISFFSGLRQDLTYLHYNQAMKELFGENYEIENIFSVKNADRESDLVKIQTKLARFNFSELEGMLDRANLKNKPFIGMRMLQQPYWPNDYIFSQLSGMSLKGLDQAADPNKITTACRTTGGRENIVYRCAGLGLDIINILQPVKNGGQYFITNANYENYSEQIDLLRNQIGKFDNYSWNNNIYWLNLDLSRTILDKNLEQSPVFMKSPNWLETKDYNTILGGWVNLHLPEDEMINYSEPKNSGLGASVDCGSYNYVEPNLDLIKEMMARNEMLVKMLTLLGVSEKTNAVSIELKVLGQKMEKILSITKKELSDAELTGEDCVFIKDFVGHYEIGNKSVKSFTLDFTGKKLEESINGLKLIAIVNQFGSKKAISIGPIFNYSENYKK